MRSWSRLTTSSSALASRSSIASTLATRASASCLERAVAAAGVEARLEELDQQPGDVDVAAQRLLDVVEGEGRVALLEVLRVGAQHGGLPPGQPGGEDQLVEAVDLVVAVPHRAQRLGEQGRARGDASVATVAQPELVDVGRPRRGPVELVRALVDDLDAHRGEHRQHRAQRQRLADPEDLEPRLAAPVVPPRSSCSKSARSMPSSPSMASIRPRSADPRCGLVVLLVGLGEGVGPGPGQPRPRAPRRTR